MSLARSERGSEDRSPRISASGSVLGLLASIALSPGQLACSVSTHTTTVPFSIRGRAQNEGLTKGALIGERGELPTNPGLHSQIQFCNADVGTTLRCPRGFTRLVGNLSFKKAVMER